MRGKESRPEIEEKRNKKGKREEERKRGKREGEGGREKEGKEGRRGRKRERGERERKYNIYTVYIHVAVNHCSVHRILLQTCGLTHTPSSLV